MFGLPDHHLLSQTVAELTRPHTHKVGDLDGIEPPLFQMLEDAVGNTSGRGSAPGGSTRAGAPVDVSALQLWSNIQAVIAEHWPGHGDLARANTPPADRLEQWASSLAGSDLETYLLEFCVYWADQIRELLYPTRRVPLRGVECVNCGTGDVMDRDQDGELVRRPAVTLYPEDSPPRAVCQVCGAEWSGTLSLQLLALV